MTAEILDGKALAQQIRDEIRSEVQQFVESHHTTPQLAAILVGDDPASDVYVRNKEKDCARVGITSQLHRLPAETTEANLLALVHRLNDDTATHGILVQLPLPEQIDELRILDAVNPRKDVDAFHPENVGLISQGRPRFLPCTPYGVQELLHRYSIATAGKEVVVVGRSDIVGKPIAMMLAQRDSPLGPEAANATVTICHSRTTDLGEVTRRADILIAAIGQPEFITAAAVKRGAVVVDVGINRTDRGLVGDVAMESVRAVASYVTPVPGGVGPLTRAMLLRNTLTAARLSLAGKSA